MNDDNRVIHLAVAFDEHYKQQFIALLSSVLANNHRRKLKWHLIASGIQPGEKERIQNYILAEGAGVEFYDLDSQSSKDLVLVGGWTHAVYFRLYFPLLVSSEVTRLLYLDSDTLAIQDLSELFDADLEDYPVAAVYDIYVRKQELIGVPEGDYFNSGVLLLDVKKWREQRISEKALAFIREFPERILYVDQCGLNAVLIDNWKRLDYKYNVLYSYLPTAASWRTLTEFLSDKVVLHFTLERPWSFLCRNRFRSLYWYYLRRSPLADRELRSYADFSFRKIPAWFKIRSAEMYFDHSWFQWTWRTIKAFGK